MACVSATTGALTETYARVVSESDPADWATVTRAGKAATARTAHDETDRGMRTALILEAEFRSQGALTGPKEEGPERRRKNENIASAASWRSAPCRSSLVAVNAESTATGTPPERRFRWPVR